MSEDEDLVRRARALLGETADAHQDAWAAEAAALLAALADALERSEARVTQLRAERDAVSDKHRKILDTVERFVHTELGYPTPPDRDA